MMIMTPGEAYDLKRKNFIDKTRHYFEFLVSEFSFNTPQHVTSDQGNGTIIRDTLEYKKENSIISISNAYHPVDYGFEINIIDIESGDEEFLRSVLKEDQDIEQTYLESEAEFMKDYLRKTTLD